MWVFFSATWVGLDSEKSPAHFYVEDSNPEAYIFPPLNSHMIQNSVAQKGEELRAQWEKQDIVNPDYFHFA